jgi:hypothetical protein
MEAQGDDGSDGRNIGSSRHPVQQSDLAELVSRVELAYRIGAHQHLRVTFQEHKESITLLPATNDGGTSGPRIDHTSVGEGTQGARVEVGEEADTRQELHLSSTIQACASKLRTKALDRSRILSTQCGEEVLARHGQQIHRPT